MRFDNHLLKHVSVNPRTQLVTDVAACVLCGAALALILFLFIR